MKISIDFSERVIIAISRHENQDPDLLNVRYKIHRYLEKIGFEGYCELHHRESSVINDYPMERWRYEIQHFFDLVDPFGRLDNPHLKEVVGHLTQEAEI